MMTVVWLLDYPLQAIGIGKQQQHPFSWSIELQKALVATLKVKLHVITFSNKIESDQKKVVDGVTFHVFKTSNFLIRNLMRFRTDLKQIETTCDEIKPDLIHVHGLEAFYGLISKRTKIPTIISIQGAISEIFKIRKKWNLSLYFYITQLRNSKTMLKYCQNFFVRTKFDSNFVRKNNDQARQFNAWEIINPIYQLNTFNDEINPTLLFLGGHIEYKGYKTVIDAFKIAKQQVPNLRLKLGGGISNKIQLSLLDNELKEEKDNVEFLSFMRPEGILNEINNAGLLINASLMENSSNVICEGQLAGIPVIASNVGGTPSLVEHDKTGLLFEAGNAQDLADKIITYLNSPDKAISVAQEAKRKASMRHNVETIVKNTISAYQTIMKEKNS